MQSQKPKPSRQVQLSKFLAKILRHHPELIGLNLDAEGWAKIDELLAKAAKPDLTRQMLEKIVAEDEKGRYEIDETQTKIRACQGHSIEVDAGQEQKPAPDVLYHGSAQKYAASIAKQGLLPMSRLFVHLSTDIPTAKKVGSRHGKPVIYRINTKQMEQDGYIFYQARNGVWLTSSVPVQYLEEIDD